MLSWRYLGHPQAGGAEVVTHEVLRRLVKRGVEVTAFTGAHAGAPATDELDGVRIVRRGRQWSVHAQAFRWLRRRLDEFDRIVEQINTIPFLTPLYVPRGKRRVLIHQLAREYWWRETPGAFKLVSPIGYLLEPLQFRFYRDTPTMTISASSRDDLVRVGLPPENVSIIPMAVHTEPLEHLDPKPVPVRCVIVGRLTPAKFVEEAIEAFALIRADLPDAELDVLGAGDAGYRRGLEQLIEARRLTGVTFHGRVEEGRKRELLRAAHLHLFSSHREGWGLTVTEAAMVGTPTIGYDAPGVRDSIADPRLLARSRTPEGLAEQALAVLRDPVEYDATRRAAWARARELTWDRTADAFLAAVR